MKGAAVRRPRSRALASTARGRLQADTRERLLAAGARAFGRVGYHGVKIAAIARDAGVANGTFYLHFRDKDALFHSVSRRTLGALAARLRAIASADPDPLASERRELEAIVDFAAEHADLLRAGLAHGAAGHTEIAALLVEQRAEAIAGGIAQGSIGARVDPQIAAVADFGMLSFALQWWVEHRDTVSRERLVETLSALRRGGLAIGGPAGQRA